MYVLQKAVVPAFEPVITENGSFTLISYIAMICPRAFFATIL